MAEMCDVEMFHIKMCTTTAYMCVRDRKPQAFQRNCESPSSLKQNNKQLNNNRKNCNAVLVLSPAIALRAALFGYVDPQSLPRISN